MEFMSTNAGRRSIAAFVVRKQQTEILLTEIAWSLACQRRFQSQTEVNLMINRAVSTFGIIAAAAIAAMFAVAQTAPDQIGSATRNHQR